MALTSPDDYDEVGLLAEGAFTETTLVRRKTDDAKFVVKRLNLTRLLEPKYRQIASDDAATLAGLHHPNILRIHNHFCERNNIGNLFYHVVIEDTENWTLADEIEKVRKSGGFFSENHVLWWSNQLTSALKYLHSKNILHRNVRPENIYLVNNNRDIKLGEFGLVRHEEICFDPKEPPTACTMSYLSPEFVEGNHEYCKKCDLWSMGVTMFEVVSQKLPQEHHSPKLGFPLKTSNVYSKELLSFIRWTLTSDEDQRPNVEQTVKHPLISENRVDQIRTLFGLPLSSDGRSSRLSDDDLEPWQFHGRSSTVKATPPWISALLDVDGKDYLLATSYSGVVSAISKVGDKVLWKTKVVAEGARGGLWHAAVDEKRGRLLMAYNGIDEPVNIYPVDIYSVPLSELEPRQKAGGEESPKEDDEATQIARAELLFHHDDWHCYGLKVDPVADVLYVCDWFENHIGIFDLDGLKTGKDPIHVITKPEQFKHFNPTRVAFIPTTPKVRPSDGDDDVLGEEPREQLIAVSDWLRSRIYLFRTIAIRNTINHEFEAVITSKGDEVGLVSSPIDLQCDPTARTLIVCDQSNSRAQVFIPDPDWPHFKAIATENLGGHFSAVAITSIEPQMAFIRSRDGTRETSLAPSKEPSRDPSVAPSVASSVASSKEPIQEETRDALLTASKDPSREPSRDPSVAASKEPSVAASKDTSRRSSLASVSTKDDAPADASPAAKEAPPPPSSSSSPSSLSSVSSPTSSSVSSVSSTSRRSSGMPGIVTRRSLGNIRVLMAGLNTGEVVSYKFKCG